MRKIIDNLLLILIGICMVVGYSKRPVETVVALLLAVTVSAMELVLDMQSVRLSVGVLYAVLCIVLPEAVFFLPAVSYHFAFEKKEWWFCGIPPVLFLYFYIEKSTSRERLILLVLFFGIAVVLGMRTSRAEKLEQEMIRLRDSTTERNLMLREKNKDLMEKQDYEIYSATLKERNRIAREIHDNVGHMLSRSILQMGALQTIHKEEPLHGQLTAVSETLNQAMNSIRESVHDLHDDSVDLRQAVTDATEQMQKNYQVVIDYDMSKTVPKNVKYCFISTVKEAMSNIVKHSNADQVSILMREHPGFYQLAVEDNGTDIARGSDVEQTGGIGISNMRERVENLNGTMRIHTDDGFKIFISIPKGEQNESIGN